MTPTQPKPSIVFCHGTLGDGSCFSKADRSPSAEGYSVLQRSRPQTTAEESHW